ncbi:MAG: RdgB/HAM1 family non-canonical purine NTP pyrophosphatase [Deltaproteobacteria bacterium]|nr:MAG: RdgB/HAM1 family non-canonical purine NTP pyrophosphatase [Deltaproteobacteria bacterium]
MKPGAAERPEVVVATSNPGKLREIRAILADLPVSFRTLADFPGVALPEESDDYEANAIAKARTVARTTGRLALGDDSGIEVDALDGAPGPHSARYGGPGLSDGERARKLLDALRAAPAGQRGARFVCVAALASPADEVVTARGECAGSILLEPRGEGGFGYDPVFQPHERDGSMAQLSPADKNRISHRARALRGLAADIERLATR